MICTMTAKEAAKYIGVSYWKVLELAKVGEVPHVRLSGKVLFREKSLDKWLAEKEDASVRQEQVPTGKIRRLGEERKNPR